MKMKFKKMSAFLVAATLWIGTVPFPMQVQAREDDGNYADKIDGWFIQDNDSFVSILGYEGEPTELVVPEQLDGRSVKEICAEAFMNETTLTSITIPGTVEMVGSSAFEGCTALESVVFAGEPLSEWSYTRISSCAFKGDTALSNVVLPENLREISEETFAGCELLEEIEFPENIWYINDKAFE